MRYRREKSHLNLDFSLSTDAMSATRSTHERNSTRSQMKSSEDQRSLWSLGDSRAILPTRWHVRHGCCPTVGFVDPVEWRGAVLWLKQA